VFAAAIKYQIDGLRDVAAERFRSAMETSLPKTWREGDYAKVLAARQACATAFPEVLTVVFNSILECITQLRDILLEVLLDSFYILKSNRTLEEAMSSIPCLGHELLRRRSLRPPTAEPRSRFVFTCKTCHQVRCEHPASVQQTYICD
jgi:hypothetical protein